MIRPPSRSLRTLLLVGMAAVAVVLTVTTVVVTTMTRSRLIEPIDERLRVASERSHQLDAPPPELQPPQGSPDRQERLSDLYEGVLTADGTQITFFAPNLPWSDDTPPEFDADLLAAVDGTALLTLTSSDGDRFRVLARRIGSTVRLTAAPLEDVERTMSRLMLVQLVGFGVVLAVLGAVTWWVITLGIRPLRRMTDTATDLAAGDLTIQVPEAASGTEASQLARALNRMLARIRAALAERARSEERLRRFVSDASHELRTPVTTIQGYAQLYRAGGLGKRDDLDDAMRRTETEATRMARLVEEMLTLAKLDEHRPLDLAPVDLAALADDAGHDARVRAPERSVSVRIDGPAMVIGDEDRLRQVVSNVVTNALVHTGSDAPIRITADLVGTMGRLQVADGGPGMPPEVAARVTERFYRADASRSRATGGSGLGLAIVESVLAAHGGELEIDSQPGHGTTITLLIPRDPTGGTESGRPDRAPAATAPPWSASDGSAPATDLACGSSG
jgi:two-component system OmpR family sensor kinase